MVKITITVPAFKAMEQLSSRKFADHEYVLVDDGEVEIDLARGTVDRLKRRLEPNETISQIIVRIATHMEKMKRH